MLTLRSISILSKFLYFCSFHYVLGSKCLSLFDVYLPWIFLDNFHIFLMLHSLIILKQKVLNCFTLGSLSKNDLSRFRISCIAFGEGNGNPLQCSCLENPRDGGAWWAAIYGVPQSRTRLKRLSSSSSSSSSNRAFFLPLCATVK